MVVPGPIIESAFVTGIENCLQDVYQFRQTARQLTLKHLRWFVSQPVP